MHESRNAVADRQTIFFDPASSELLKQAVDAGAVKRSAGAKLVRDVQRDPAVASVIQQVRAQGVPFEQIVTHPAMAPARAKVFAETQRLLGKKERKKPPQKPVMTEEAWGVLVANAAAVNLLRKKLLVQVESGKVHVTVVGPADADPNVYDPLAPTTRLSWSVDVQAAVDLLPGELRSQVTVADVETLDPVRCPTCGGTRFHRAGGCVKCQPMFSLVGMLGEMEDAEWRSRRALYDQLVHAARVWRRARGYEGEALKVEEAKDETIRLADAALAATRCIAAEEGIDVPDGATSPISAGPSGAANLSEVEFARFMGVSPRTIASDRKHMTEGVHYHRHGRRVLYHIVEAQAFLRNFKRPVAGEIIQRLAVDEVTRRRARMALRRSRGTP
jgi:hypothetical protein